MVKTKEKIIKKSKELFGKNGYVSVSMSDIAKKVGVTKASLYYFFKCKEEIYSYIVEELLENSIKIVASENYKDLSPKKKLSATIKSYIEMSLKQGMMVAPDDTCHIKKHDFHYKKIMAKVAQVKKLLENFLERQNVPEVSMASEIILNSVHSYIIHSKFKKSFASPLKYADYLAGLFIKKTDN